MDIQRHESRTNSKFMAFVRQLAEQGGWGEVDAVRYCAVVLTLLEQRLTGDQTRRFEAQLPAKLREVLSEVPKSPENKPLHRFHRDDFIATAGEDLSVSREEAEGIIRAVFATIRGLITEGESAAIEDELPRDMKHLWAMPV